MEMKHKIAKINNYYNNIATIIIILQWILNTWNMYNRSKVKKKIKEKENSTYILIVKLSQRDARNTIRLGIVLLSEYERNFWDRGSSNIRKYIKVEFSNGNSHFWHAIWVPWMNAAQKKTYTSYNFA